MGNKHTAGPWKAYREKRALGNYDIISDAYLPDLLATTVESVPLDEKANAELIASAPTMKAMLEEVQAFLLEPFHHPDLTEDELNTVKLVTFGHSISEVSETFGVSRTIINRRLKKASDLLGIDYPRHFTKVALKRLLEIAFSE